MVHLTQFSHIGVLEVYHSQLNKWAPKSTHFSYKDMVVRFQLTAIDFNQSQNLEQAKTKDGVNRTNTCFSKMTKTRAVKPIKEAKDLVTNRCSYLPIIKVQFFVLKGKREKSIHPTPYPLCMTEICNPIWKGNKHYNMITF